MWKPGQQVRQDRLGCKGQGGIVVSKVSKVSKGQPVQQEQREYREYREYKGSLLHKEGTAFPASPLQGQEFYLTQNYTPGQALQLPSAASDWTERVAPSAALRGIAGIGSQLFVLIHNNSNRFYSSNTLTPSSSSHWTRNSHTSNRFISSFGGLTAHNGSLYVIGRWQRSGFDDLYYIEKRDSSFTFQALSATLPSGITEPNALTIYNNRFYFVESNLRRIYVSNDLSPTANDWTHIALPSTTILPGDASGLEILEDRFIVCDDASILISNNLTPTTDDDWSTIINPPNPNSRYSGLFILNNILYVLEDRASLNATTKIFTFGLTGGTFTPGKYVYDGSIWRKLAYVYV